MISPLHYADTDTLRESVTKRKKIKRENKENKGKISESIYI